MTSILNLSGKELERELDKIAQSAIRYRYWTPKEDEILTKLYQRGMALNKIGDVLGRSPNGVDGRVKSLGLKRRKP